MKKNKVTLTIRLKLMLGLGLSALVMLGVGYLGVHGESQSNANTSDIYLTDLQPILDIAKVSQSVNANQLSLTRLLIERKADHLAAVTKQMQERSAEERKAWQHYYPMISSDRERQAANAFVADLSTVSAANERALALAAAKDFDGMAQVLGEDYQRTAAQMDESIDILYQENEQQANASYVSSEKSFQLTRWGSVAALAFGMLLMLALLVVLLRAIATPIQRAALVADAIASGRLGNDIDTSRRDEVGRLMLALDRMDGQLSAIVARVRASASSIVSASKQIAAGNDDLSHRTQEQASNLEETATSMQGLTGNVRNNADNTGHVSALVEQALDQAHGGQTVVAQAASAMDDIHASSKRIEEIISLVDDVAFQTNLLALNAAVEAARAGEHGRGFAIVVTEVRALAQRSGSAARDIRQLIRESSQRVGNGLSLVDSSKTALQQIHQRMSEIAHTTNALALAGNEQARGIDQINMAVSQLDLMTQQNAAMVEEMAAASQNLHGLAGELMEHVDFFQIRQRSGTSADGSHGSKQLKTSPAVQHEATAA